MAFTADLIDGLARLLAAAETGVYRPSGPAPSASETAIFIGNMPAAPDRAICLTPYPVSDDVTTDSVTAVQIRMRAGTNFRQLTDLMDEVWGQLHNRRGYDLGSVHVQVSWRQSHGLLGQDANGRDERADNYYFRASRTSPHLYE